MSDRASPSEMVTLSTALMQGAASDNVLTAIRNLKPSDIGPELEHTMLMTLSDTPSPRLRNSLALILAEAKAGGLVDRVAKLLSDDRTSGSRGTLLYALHKYGAELPLQLLVTLIANDTPEAAEEAFMMLEEAAPHTDLREKNAAAALLLDSVVRRGELSNLDVALDAWKVLTSR